jgi:hypothetical protein
MATPQAHKVAPAAKRAPRKAATPEPGLTVAYAFSGDIVDLPKVVEKGFAEKGFQTVVIPETPEAEKALKRSRRFRRLRRTKAKMVVEKAFPTKVEAVIAAMDPTAYQPDARAKAILRGKTFALEDLKAAGGSYGIEEVRALLDGVSRQAVDKRVSDGALLAVPGPSGHRRFPTIQFNSDGSLVKGLKQVREALGFSSPWAELNFLVNQNERLSGRRPIEALRAGDLEPVLAAAHSIGVQGA